MKAIYYATCWANGPISVRLHAQNGITARKEFSDRAAEDWMALEEFSTPALDAEEDLGINPSHMDEEEWETAMRAQGCVLAGALDRSWSLWRRFDLLELPPGSRHNCAYDGTKDTEIIGYSYTLQLDNTVSPAHPVTHVVLRHDVRVHYCGTTVFAIWHVGQPCPFV